jgi:hypothetical protein
MGGTLVCIAVAVLGIEPGWQRLEGGGWQYVIQLDSQNLEALKAGESLGSDIPPELRDIRRYQITLGPGKPPREILPEPALSEGPELRPPRQTMALGPPARSEPGPSARVGPELSGNPPSRVASGLSGDRPTTFGEQVLAKPKLEGPSPSAKPAAPEAGTEAEAGSDSKKPWLALTLALAAAFACFGGMLYMGWIAWDYRQRYLALFRQMIDAGLKTAGDFEEALLADTGRRVSHP